MLPKPPPHSAGLAVEIVNAHFNVGRFRRVTKVLESVSLGINLGELVAIIGSSGSGKSSLIRALAGYIELNSGIIRINQVATSSRELRTDRRIAYLPQDIVVHEELTAAEAIRFSSRLRGSTRPTELRTRSKAVLERVGLADRADLPIRKLSGGQRKRAALAVELLGDPTLLLLDEPTSGLDPASESELMFLFRSLADEGRTVVVVTHTPNKLSLCDKIIVMNGGRCVFCGPPATLPSHFEVKRVADVYLALADRNKMWPAVRESQQAFYDASLVSSLLQSTKEQVSFLEQVSVLIVRYARLQCCDMFALVLQIAQPAVIGMLVAITFGNITSRFAEQHAADSRQVFFMMVVAVLWCAGAASVREVVKELHLIRHESRFGLDLRAYVASKLLLLGSLAVVQAVILWAIVRWTVTLPGAANAQLAVLGLTALAGVGVGLLISAIAGTSERAITLLPVTLIGMSLFSGGLARLNGAVQWMAAIGSPAYWAMDGLRALLPAGLRNATYPGAPGTYQPPILGSGGPLLLDLIALALQATVLLAVTWYIIRRRIKS